MRTEDAVGIRKSLLGHHSVSTRTPDTSFVQLLLNVLTVVGALLSNNSNVSMMSVHQEVMLSMKRFAKSDCVAGIPCLISPAASFQIPALTPMNVRKSVLTAVRTE